MNSQYRFDDAYLNCVASHMEEQRPFGDIPKKVANSVKKSLVASRALSKALKSGFQIAEEMRQVRDGESEPLIEMRFFMYSIHILLPLGETNQRVFERRPTIELVFSLPRIFQCEAM